MNLSPLTALSPLDGRYSNKLTLLRQRFSEYALILHRVKTEIEWLKALGNSPEIAEVAQFSNNALIALDAVCDAFSEADAQAIKTIESRINHDVKAVEYWLIEKFATNTEISKTAGFFHFACTSEDINNICYALMVKDARDNVILPALNDVLTKLETMAHEHAELAMLSRTHGQPATPTTLGKEIANFAYRLGRQRKRLTDVKILAKINGAVGNYNAHVVAYPELNWEKFSQAFIESIGLEFNPYTTQIEPHDFLAELFDAIAAINTILIDLNRDCWAYISIGYFQQSVDETEVGSSTMPHKVNPIDFENAEGNLGLANALLRHLSEKLPISRWQRDLTDSTVLRNIGVALGYTLLAYHSCNQGLGKLHVNAQKVRDDMDRNWDVLAEAVQTVMRRCGIKNSYDQLKELTRGKAGISKESLHVFINALAIPQNEKQKLLRLTPWTYIGNAAALAKQI